MNRKKKNVYTEAERNPLASSRGSAMMDWVFQSSSAKMDEKSSKFSGPLLIAFESLACGQKECQGREGPGRGTQQCTDCASTYRRENILFSDFVLIKKNPRVRSKYSR